MTLSGDLDVSGCKSTGQPPEQANTSGQGPDKPAPEGGVGAELCERQVGQKDREMMFWNTPRARHTQT